MPQSKHQGPIIYISGLPRSTPKAAWKAFYSISRTIYWRDLEERNKVVIDMVLFGFGFYEMTEDGLKHIPPEKVVLV